MKLRYRLFQRRNGMFFVEDRITGKQQSLKTRDEHAAKRIFNARNESHEQPAINLQIARAYLMASDPMVVKRTWQHAMEEVVKTKQGPTQSRWQTAIKDKAFDSIRAVTLLQTQAEHLLRVLEKGTVSTNVHLRKLHNFCLDMNWLPWGVIPKRRWPPVQFKEKRAIRLEEHEKILGGERNPEWRAYYKMLWHVGGSQSDVARLCAEDVDWANRVLSFVRSKNGAIVMLHFGNEVANLLSDLPGEGHLFPRIARLTESDRGSLFRRRCRLVGVSGVSLHSYRYAWAERAKVAGYPERFAQEALRQRQQQVGV